MAFLQGASEGYLEFLSAALNFLTKVSPASLAIAPGGNGSGTMTQPTADAGVKMQTWTATCATGGGDGVALFDVFGSVSGANAGQATSGSAYNENVQFTIGANGGTFVVGDTFGFTTGSWQKLESRSGAVSALFAGPGNVGDGTVSQPTADAGSTPQRWVLECATPGGDGVAVFSVTGSFSGAKSNATSGAAYNDEVQFTISAGGVAWAVGDKLIFWVDGEVYLTGAEAPTTQKPFVNIQTVHDVGQDRYNWILQGATSQNAGLGFDDQTGAIPTGQGQPCLLLWNSPITHTVVADDRRFLAIAVAPGQPVESCHCGFFQAFGPPENYPFPLLIGGCHFDPTKNAVVQELQHTWWAFDDISTAGQKSSGQVLTPGNAWARLREFSITILGNSELNYFIGPTGTVPTDQKMATQPGGEYWKHECIVVIHQNPAGPDQGASAAGDKMPSGYIPGLYWVTGFNLTTGTTLGNTPSHYVFQNAFRNDVADFQAIAMEP